MVGFDFQKSEELKYNHSQQDVGGELKKRRKNNENMQRRCTLTLIWVVIYSKCLNRKVKLATSQGFTSLLRHSQEKNQAAEEEQGPHDQSWDQEGPVLGARRHTVNI